VGFLSRPAVVAVPASFGHVDVQTLPVEGGGARLTAQQTAPCSTGGASRVAR